MKTVEAWKPIKGYEGHYKISNHGNVLALKRKVKHSRSILITKKERILKSSIMLNGKPYYKHVVLCIDGKHETCPIHHLVARAFIGKNPGGCDVMHKDGNLLNNHVSNIVYGTRKENMEMAIEHGTTTRGVKNPMAKLTESKVKRIRKLYEKGMLQREIGDMFGVDQRCISLIVNGKRWGWM